MIAGLYSAFATKTSLTSQLLADEIAGTRPLATTMAEQVAQLREWAQGRAVPAN